MKNLIKTTEHEILYLPNCKAAKVITVTECRIVELIDLNSLYIEINLN